MKIISKFVNYIKDSKEELKKVVWPTKKQTQSHTILVIGISLGVAAFLGIVDYILSLGFEIIISLR